MKNFLILLFLVLNFTANCQKLEYTTPVIITNDWPVASLTNVGLDEATMVNAVNRILSNPNHKIHSFLIVKNDHLVFEEYFGGYELNQQHDLRSVTKSVIALLVGMAIDQGLFGLDDPVINHLTELKNPKNPDPRKSQITIRHLLTMSTGLDCNDWSQSSKGQEDRIYKKKNWIQALADLPMIDNPGAKSDYCTGGVMMLATILERKSGLPLPRFAQQYLFGPMNIKNISWGHTNKKEVIDAGKRVYMLPRDMAKLGSLILNNGRWNGKKLIPQDWIKELKTTKTKIGTLNYSFWWWQIEFPNGGKPIIPTVATGNGGQYIMCFPEQDMIVVFTGGAFNSQEQQMPFGIVNNFVLPALR